MSTNQKTEKNFPTIKPDAVTEHGQLSTVIVHIPHEKTSLLTPQQKKHLAYPANISVPEVKMFVKTLEENDVQVLYLEKLIVEVLSTEEDLKDQFIGEFIKKSNLTGKLIQKGLLRYFNKLSVEKLVAAMIGGVEYTLLQQKKFLDLKLIDTRGRIFVSDPLPNLVFQRDLAVAVDHGLILGSMKKAPQKILALFIEYIFYFHPHFRKAVPKASVYFGPSGAFNLEGGDVMMLNKKNLIIGNTAWTELEAIADVAYKISKDSKTTIKNVYAIQLPPVLSHFHLDRLITPIGFAKFIVSPAFIKHESKMKIFQLSATGKSTLINKKPTDWLAELLTVKPNFIVGGEVNGTNVLTIAPETVVSYSWNEVTNKALVKAGIKVIELSDGDITKAHKYLGPRAICMPLIRLPTNCCKPAPKN